MKKIVLSDEEMKVFLKREPIGLGLILLICLLPIFVWGFLIINSFFKTFPVESSRVVINDNEGFLQIADKLEKAKVLPNSGVFKIYVLLSGQAKLLRSGTYDFAGVFSVISLVDRLTGGPSDVSVVIPEGFTIFEIDKRLSDLNLIKQGSLVAEAQKPEEYASTTEFSFLPKENLVSLEGFLFPDTYRFAQRTEAKEVIEKMLWNFKKKVYDKLDPEIASSSESLNKAVILASILEKEVITQEDREIVSGILWKRLEKDMLLQVDASVVYAWKITNPDWKPQDHALNAADLKIKSLYNTYLYKGLPQGSIANPGWSAIQAALNPRETDYLFYLSTREGQTIFSRNLEEHNEAVKKYLR